MSAHILVVDDEPDLEPLIRQKLRKQIQSEDYVISFARDGEEALARVQDDPTLDIILTDINMPGMDGLTLLSRLHELHRLMRVVMVSAYGDMENIRSAMNNGAFDFVTKPIDFRDLERTIQKTLADLRTFKAEQKARTRAERARSNLSRHFSPSLAEHLATHPERLEAGGARKELTFLFTDIADFTPLVEKSDPDRIVTLLNEYLDTVAGIVFAHGGTVNTVIGDAISALFGAPLDQPDHAEMAVACARAIDDFSERFRKQQVLADLPLGHTRIGVHTGTAIVGNFGGETFFHFTAHGDAVNTAARLEAANKQLGTRICVSAETASRIPGFVGRPIGRLRVKGKDRPVDVLEPWPLGGQGMDALDTYRRAFEKLETGESSALQDFAAHISAYPDDRLAAFHLERLLSGHGGIEIDLPN